MLRAIIYDRPGRAAAGVILGWSEVHLVLLSAAWLNHTRWLPDNLLIRRSSIPFAYLTHLRVVSEAQVELRGIQLYNVGHCGQFLHTKLIRLLLDLDNIGRLREVCVPLLLIG